MNAKMVCFVVPAFALKEKKKGKQGFEIHSIHEFNILY